MGARTSRPRSDRADALGVSVTALTEGPAQGRARVVSDDAVVPLWADRGAAGPG